MNTGKIPKNMHSVNPYMTVRDVDEAVKFYEKAFGFRTHMKMPGPDGGKSVHAEMLHGDSMIMLGHENPSCGAVAPAADAPGLPCTLYLYVEDVDKFCAHAKESGAKVKQEPTDMFYGDRCCGLIDPFGHHWGFATHVKEVSMDDMKKGMEQMKQTANA